MRQGLQIAALLTVGYAAWQLMTFRTTSSDAMSAQIGTGLASYRAIVNDLPPSETIGFISTTNDPAFNSANQYVAQHALAPRVVTLAFNPQARFVVSGVNPPASFDTYPSLAGFELVAVRAMGIRIFRRTHP